MTLHREDLHPRHTEEHRLSQQSQQNPHASAITTKSSYHHNKILMHLHPIKILGSHMDTISLSFPVNPGPDGGAPVNRHSRLPIDATCALIGRGLVLMTLNTFERVAVSIKLVNMLFRSSSPPASLVFDVFFMRTNFQKTFENGI